MLELLLAVALEAQGVQSFEKKMIGRFPTIMLIIREIGEKIFQFERK